LTLCNHKILKEVLILNRYHRSWAFNKREMICQSTGEIEYYVMNEFPSFVLLLYVFNGFSMWLLFFQNIINFQILRNGKFQNIPINEGPFKIHTLDSWKFFKSWPAFHICMPHSDRSKKTNLVVLGVLAWYKIGNMKGHPEVSN
jgi:hypothetical protein